MSGPAASVDAWLRANGYAATRDPGSSRVSISFDSVRTHFHVLPGNNLLLEARLCDLPSSMSERDRVVERAMTISAGRMRDNPASLACDEELAALWLQRRLPGSITTEKLDEAVEHLVNEVEMWRLLL